MLTISEFAVQYKVSVPYARQLARSEMFRELRIAIDLSAAVPKKKKGRRNKLLRIDENMLAEAQRRGLLNI